MSSSIEEQIKEIEKEIFNTQKNKATEHHIGKLKAKIARLRQVADKQRSKETKGKGFSLKKSGDATVGLIGFPSVGKSTLINQLTDASSKIGEYDFTTIEVIPGMMKYKGADIQILDFPGLIEGASKGRGRGKEILSAIRNVDLLLLMIDVSTLEQFELIINELFHAGLRLNQTKPDVVITKKGQGGIEVHATIPLSYLQEGLIRSIASEFVVNADITIREDITEDQLIDVFADNRIYTPALVVINKIDLISSDSFFEIETSFEKKGWNVIGISAKTGLNLSELRENIYSNLQLIRVFLKPVGKQVDYSEPMILKLGESVGDACQRIHRDFQRKFRYATITGPSAKHTSQKVGLDHVLHDQDILTIVIKK
jgi:small GTP-binding protein